MFSRSLFIEPSCDSVLKKSLCFPGASRLNGLFTCSSSAGRTHPQIQLTKLIGDFEKSDCIAGCHSFARGPASTDNLGNDQGSVFDHAYLSLCPLSLSLSLRANVWPCVPWMGGRMRWCARVCPGGKTHQIRLAVWWRRRLLANRPIENLSVAGLFIDVGRVGGHVIFGDRCGRNGGLSSATRRHWFCSSLARLRFVDPGRLRNFCVSQWRRRSGRTGAAASSERETGEERERITSIDARRPSGRSLRNPFMTYSRRLLEDRDEKSGRMSLPSMSTTFMAGGSY